MAHPEIAFTLTATTTARCCASAPRRRSAGRCGGGAAGAPGRRSWAASSPTTRCRIDAEREGVRLTGYIGLPTLNRATSAQQYLFVNGRPVRDRLLQGAVRGAYQDFLARDRHPLVALFLELPAGGGRCQRPSGQGRGALPRCRPGARPDRRRLQACAGRRPATAPPPPWPPAALGSFRPGDRPQSAGESAWRPQQRAPRAARLRRAGRRALCAARSAVGGRRTADVVLDARGARPRPTAPGSRLSRSAPRGPSCTRPTSSPRPPTASSSSTSMPPMSGWSMSA